MPGKECKKQCSQLHVCNPASGKCVLKTGPTGRKILESSSSSKKCPPCGPEKMCNPASGRCVLKTGPTGRKLLGGTPSTKKSPPTVAEVVRQLPTMDARDAWRFKLYKTVDTQTRGPAYGRHPQIPFPKTVKEMQEIDAREGMEETLELDGHRDWVWDEMKKQLPKNKLLGPSAKIATAKMLAALVPAPGDSVRVVGYLCRNPGDGVIFDMTKVPVKSRPFGDHGDGLTEYIVFRPRDLAHWKQMVPKEAREYVGSEPEEWNPGYTPLDHVWWVLPSTHTPYQFEVAGQVSGGDDVLGYGDYAYGLVVWL
jgi:hypothetical protein